MCNWFVSIIQGAIGSLIATPISALIIYCTRKWWFRSFQSELANTYNGKAKLLKALQKDLGSVNSLRILAMRGETVEEGLKDKIEDMIKKKSAKEIKIVMTSISNTSAIDVRCRVINETEEEYKKKILHTASMYALINRQAGGQALKQRFFNDIDVLPFRLIFVGDEFVYVSAYTDNEKINDGKHFKYRKHKAGGSTYTAYEQYFNQVFNYAHDYTTEVDLWKRANLGVVPDLGDI